MAILNGPDDLVPGLLPSYRRRGVGAIAGWSGGLLRRRLDSTGGHLVQKLFKLC
jgi:hypothetical protein